MPLITVSVTPDVRAALDLDELLLTMHRTALDLGCFPVHGIRTVLVPWERALIADGAEGRGYLQVNVRIAPGRTSAVVTSIVDAFHDAVLAAIEQLPGDPWIRYQVDLTEFDDECVRRGGSVLGAPTTPGLSEGEAGQKTGTNGE